MLADEASLGDATALTAGALLTGTGLDGNELGSSLGDARDVGGEVTLEIGALALVAPDAE
ncbi:MAG TPA: hypothetical protein VII50_01915 [Acidothermaceae bacterium]